MEVSNPRFLLRAYEGVDCCRTARILSELKFEGISPAPREVIAERWAVLYPRHAEKTGTRSIMARLGKALSVLSIAGTVSRLDDLVIIEAKDQLEMASRNLDIVQDASGVAVRPGEWTQRPEAPHYLKAMQDELAARPTRIG